MKRSIHLLPVAIAALALLCGACTIAAHAQNVELLPPTARTAATASAPIPQASGVSLLNLTSVGASIAAGDAACPDQPHYLYAGGKPDNFAPAVDLAYPSPNLQAYNPAGRPTVAYDANMVDGRFVDSFNLQNTRGVCYAVIEFRAKVTNVNANNDGLTIGHVANATGTAFDVVAQVINPGAVTGVQSYALTKAGRTLLATQTGWGLDKSPAQSVLDLFLQDDTALDYFRLYVWYAPNCAQLPGQSAC